ncbi:MAG: LysM peptidoglycan-binding domain-containing protein [Bacillota bacterium]
MKKDLLKKIFIFTLVLAVFLNLGCVVYAEGNSLKKGETSEEVKSVQEMLKKLGYFEEDCTGYFGPVTENAVKEFQKDNKLTVDGVVGPQTLKQLKKKYAEKIKTTSRGSSESGSVIHTVVQGDSIWKLAQDYGVTVDSILKANNLSESSVLQIGDKITIPGAKSNDDSGITIEAIYTVKEGDCASLIAEDYGVSVKALLKANNLTEDSVLKIGQIIIIPGDEADDSEIEETEQNNSADTSDKPGTDTAEEKTSSNVTKGEYLNWYDEVQYIFERGDIAVVTDVKTGKTFKVKRYQGHNHADAEPLTAEDTAVMKELYGSWSWDRRAIIVTIDGRNIAASMNGMPHGTESITDNKFKGHFCIHFKGSKTHAGNRVDRTHQAMVKKAAGL